MQLVPAAIRSGVRLEAYATLGSTNETALARARAGERGPLWITAERQTAGRGRRGRTWVSEPGNLHASLLLTDPSPAQHAAELSFVAALAVHDAIVAEAPPLRPRVAIKWPNDILIGGAKSAGILIEGDSMPGRPVAVAVGIGVNCSHHPSGAAFAATDLASSGVAVTPQRLFRVLSATMLDRLAQWQCGHGFASIRADWLQRAAGLGSDIRVGGNPDIEGRFETLDAGGRLVLRLCDGTTKTISAGDVFPLSAAVAGSSRGGGGSQQPDARAARPARPARPSGSPASAADLDPASRRAPDPTAKPT